MYLTDEDISKILGKKKTPPADISYYDDCLYIELAIPGFTKENIDIELNGDLLKVTGKYENESVIYTFTQDEIFKKDFEAKFKIKPEFLSNDTDNIKVNLENGILYIAMFMVENSKKKKITIE